MQTLYDCRDMLVLTLVAAGLDKSSLMTGAHVSHVGRQVKLRSKGRRGG